MRGWSLIQIRINSNKVFSCGVQKNEVNVSLSGRIWMWKSTVQCEKQTRNLPVQCQWRGRSYCRNMYTHKHMQTHMGAHSQSMCKLARALNSEGTQSGDLPRGTALSIDRRFPHHDVNRHKDTNPLTWHTLELTAQLIGSEAAGNNGQSASDMWWQCLALLLFSF